MTLEDDLRMKKLIVVGIAGFTFGCASKKVEAPAAPATPAKTETPAAASTAPKAATATAPASGVNCERDSDKRTIAIEASADGKGCSVQYTKFDKTERAAWSDTSRSHCDTVQARMQKNLEGAGFKCSK